MVALTVEEHIHVAEAHLLEAATMLHNAHRRLEITENPVTKDRIASMLQSCTDWCHTISLRLGIEP